MARRNLFPSDVPVGLSHLRDPDQPLDPEIREEIARNNQFLDERDGIVPLFERSQRGVQFQNQTPIVQARSQILDQSPERTSIYTTPQNSR